MSGVVLRGMREKDVFAVHALEEEIFPEDAWSAAMLSAELEGQPGTRHYLVAEIGGEIVGYAGLAAAGGQADVQTIGVRADRRGAGVGATLLTALLDEAERRKCEAVFLEVRADNASAQRLYERFGFQRIGLRRGYYQPSGVDAVVMSRRAGRRGPVGFSRRGT